MTKYYCTPAQMREIEIRAGETGLSLYKLMENAGSSAAAQIIRIMNEKNIKGKISVICGKGNNGGDGFVIARNLSEAGLQVTCIMTCNDAGTDLAAKELGELYSEEKVNVIILPADDPDKAYDVLFYSAVIVDAVFGTGFHGELPPEIAAVLKYASECDGFKIAIDIPSGGDGQTGAVSDGTMKCDVTLALGIEKIGTALSPLSEYSGDVVVCNLGIPLSCVESMDGLLILADAEFVKSQIPVRDRNSHKGTFGKVLNIAGSKNMPGAAALSTEAALRSGAGIVRVASVEKVVNVLSARISECIYMTLKAGTKGEISADNAEILLKEAENSDVCAVGCGLSVAENTKKLVKELVNNAKIPLIIDGDGINCIASCIDIIRNAKGGAAITPHPAELSRVLEMSVEQVAADRLGAAIRFNSLYETPILIKGSPTFIIGSDASYVSFTGNPGLARGGSGDVLTGIAAGFTAMGIPLTKALACAAYVHGRAADIAAQEMSQTGMLPRDVISRLPLVFKELDR